MRGLFGKHKWLKVLLPILLIVVIAAFTIPVFAAAPTYLDVTGTYDVTKRVTTHYMDGTRHPSAIKGTLTITTQVDKAITDATLTTLGADIALTGLVGGGTRPYIVLHGTDSDGQFCTLYCRVRVDRNDNVTRLYGRITGYTTSAGTRWVNGTGTSTVSTAQAYSGVLSTLLTGAADSGPVALIFHKPYNNLKLKYLDTLAASSNGLSFYYYASQASIGPQVGLRFAPKGSTGADNMGFWGEGTTTYVDVMVMPLQLGAVTTTWTKYTITSDSGVCVYYGTDGTDYTSYGGTPITTLGEVEAAINAEAAMLAGSDTCGEWVLVMVTIDIYEVGVRTVYIDDVQIGRYIYTLEPSEFSSSFAAKPQS